MSLALIQDVKTLREQIDALSETVKSLKQRIIVLEIEREHPGAVVEVLPEGVRWSIPAEPKRRGRPPTPKVAQ